MPGPTPRPAPADAPPASPSSDRAVVVPGARSERAIHYATWGAVLTVATIAALISYRHMRTVAHANGEDDLNATVIPLSVDGLIVAASMTMLADSRAGRSRHWLSYLLLALGSAASLAANVMHAAPTLPARIIAAWPPIALIGAYDLLMRQIRAAGWAHANSIHNTTPLAPSTAAGASDEETAPQAVIPAPATSAAHGRETPTKKERLRLLLAEQIDPDDNRSVYALARDLAPQIGLHEGTARRYLTALIASSSARTMPPGKPMD
ncbi:DUF2637 domain-containing protein [Frankia sp. Cj3]|uniref:DUF2637 domain-containing protein n=1 Tax=Frankia sp. Cj3 TaxID=2880976 RepID=UPI001EF5AD7F|nr:DUF2637 domain-containing protein [Frankia sp. Cj3]